MKSFKWLVLLVLVCPWWAISQPEEVRPAAQWEGKKTGGFSKVRLECRRGDSVSCYEYGQYLRERNQLAEAAAAYGRGCNELSHQVLAACAAAGTIAIELRREAKRKKLTDEAQSWYRKGRTYLSIACNKDVLVSCHNLGVLLHSSPDTRDSAIRLFKRACVEVLLACKILGRTAVVKKEYQKAYDLFFKGCEKFDDPDSCYQAGRVAERHLGDPTLAMNLFERACDFGYSLACLAIAQSHEDKGDLEGAITVLDPLCHQDFNMQACSKLAKLEEKMGHISRAIAAYREICESQRNGALACYNMALLEEKRGRVSKAKKAFVRACQTSLNPITTQKACTKACNGYKDQASCKKLNE